MDQQKITEEELNRELKGNKTTAADPFFCMQAHRKNRGSIGIYMRGNRPDPFGHSVDHPCLCTWFCKR